MRSACLLFAALAIGATVSQLAVAQVEIEEEGRVIRIGPDRTENQAAPDVARQRFNRFASPAESPALSDFMIGIAAEPVSDELRAHVELPMEAGLIVRTVVPESAAEKAGVKELDILVKADGKPLTSMEQLVDAVDNHGKSETAVTLELSRKGELVTVSVTPVKRENVAIAGNAPGAMLPVPGGRNMQLELRELGPMFGMMRGQAFNMNNVPNGVSISINKQNDQPAEITVKRGDETWTVVGDDEEALAKLPEDLRPMVERMTSGEQAGAMFGWSPLVPMDDNGDFAMPVPPRHEDIQAEMEVRLKEVERMMQEMRERIEQQQ